MDDPTVGSASLVDLFAAVAASDGDAVAVTDGARSLTYAQLDAAAAAIARRLHTEMGVGPGDRVAVLVAPSVELVAALLAVLRCGAAYVPLDPQSPPARHELIVADAAPGAAIGDSIPYQGPTLPAARLAELLRQPDAEPIDLARADHTAYVIYTSGTTGRPKGVPVTHANVLALLAATGSLFDIGPDDTWLLYHSVAFDFSVWEMWGALAHGGRLVVPDRWTRLSASACAELLVRERVSVLNQTPTAFSVLSKAILARADRPPLRYVVFGGERLAPATLADWVAAVGVERPALINMYGLTEATVHTTFRRVTAGDVAGGESVIGQPLPGFTTRVLGGEPGELTVAGPQVAAGYLKRPDLTAARFRPGPDGLVYYHTGDLVTTRFDGELVYLGRADRQVKVRGHRVELGEVEAAMAALPAVSGAAVLLRADDLQCFYTTRDGAGLTVRQLRGWLRARLPPYMMPIRFTFLPMLPVTTNGKVDYEALQKGWESST